MKKIENNNDDIQNYIHTEHTWQMATRLSKSAPFLTLALTPA